MILITKADTISFATVNIYGTGMATIDWGDGTVKTLTLSSEFSNLSDYKEFQHSYSDTVPHTITISGQKITRLDCLCELTNIDISQNTALTELVCTRGPLTSLDVSQNTALTSLSCTGNQLTSLDVSKNTKLTLLDCNNNQLTSLNVSNNTKLMHLDCYDNQLESLDVSQNIALKTLRCFNNKLISLNVSKNTMLTKLWCFGNRLTNLDMSKNVTLTELACSSNQLSTNSLSDLFKTLHGYTLSTTKTISISNNPGTDDSDTNIAIDKGWIVNK